MNVSKTALESIPARARATVLTAVYNSPDLFETLDSVRRQQYRPLQLILIDDASDFFDETSVRAFLSAAGEGFSSHILRNERNLGPVASLNRGLAIAEGKYIFNLADDDVFEDEHVLEDWVAAFEQTDSDVLTARRADYDRELKTVCGISPPEKAVQAIRTLSSEALFEYIARDNPISGACTAWRLSSLKKLGFYDERYRMIEDYPAYLRLLRQGGKIGFFDRVVIRYRSGGMSTEGSGYSDAYARDYNRIVREEILPFTGHPLAVKNRLRRWNNNHRFDRWYNGRIQNSKCGWAERGLLKIFYQLYHPIRSLRSIKKVWEKNER